MTLPASTSPSDLTPAPGRSWAWLVGPLLTIVGIVVMAALAPTPWAIPYPALVFLLPIVYSAYSGGLVPGLVSAAIAVVFMLTYLSQPGRWFHYDPESFPHAITLTVMVPAIAVLASLLRQRAERRMIAIAAARAAERYRDLVDDIDGVVWEADASSEPFRFTFVSRRAEMLLGHPVARWLVEPGFWMACVHPDDRARVLAFARESAHSGARRMIEYRAITASGRTVWLRDRMHGAGPGGGRAGLLRGVILDITDQKIAEQGLIASEARKGAILESALDCIMTLDHEGRILDFNPAAERVFGFTEEQAVGRTAAELMIPPELHDTHRASLKRTEMVARRVETVALRADGSQIDIDLAMTRVPGSDPPVITAFVRDITEKKRAEAELRGTLSLLSATLESTADGLLVVDRDGRILSYNHRFAEMWKIPQSVLDARDDQQAIAAVLAQVRDPDAFVAKVRDLYAQPEAESFDVIEFKDGRAFERYSRPQRIEGRSVGRVWSFRDITERRRAEAALRESELQLRQSQKMDAIGRLAGGVAHDFNNLLTVILGYCEQMLDQIREGEPMRHAAEEIRHAAERAAALTNQLLAFSRKQMTEPRQLDLNAVVGNTIRMLKRLIGEDITLAVDLDPRLGRVLADEGHMQQVVLNLAINARDAMPNGGRLSIATANAELDEAFVQRHVPLTPGRYVMLSVSDTGIGMDDETQARMFEPFFTTKDHGHGTGLGLSTVYGIVKQSGGYIWVYSEPGKGSSFKVYLPRLGSLEEVEVVTPAPPVAAAHGNETVLLVEDEAMVRGMVRDMLVERGYEVLTAGTGEEALEVAGRHKGDIHVMVTDVVMPGMGGPDLARRLAPAHPDMRVLFISGYTDDAVLRHGVRDGSAAFLQKPFTLEGLARKVREVLDAGLPV
jgi:two-component system, cell cycle sensor histidine kinase and response regulator CckA